jgi:hypothetical protein
MVYRTNLSPALARILNSGDVNVIIGIGEPCAGKTHTIKSLVNIGVNNFIDYDSIVTVWPDSKNLEFSSKSSFESSFINEVEKLVPTHVKILDDYIKSVKGQGLIVILGRPHNLERFLSLMETKPLIFSILVDSSIIWEHAQIRVNEPQGCFFDSLESIEEHRTELDNLQVDKSFSSFSELYFYITGNQLP